MRIFHVSGEQFTELHALPESLPATGFLWLGTSRRVFELRSAEPAEAPLFEAEYRHTPRKATELVVSRAIDGGWDVSGGGIERVIITTDMHNEEAVAFLQRRLERMGVEERLRKAGAVDGDTVHIGSVSFEFEAHEGPAPQDDAADGIEGIEDGDV